jgi:predicted NAD/FAD-dependent oxidoreductase
MAATATVSSQSAHTQIHHADRGWAHRTSSDCEGTAEQDTVSAPTPQLKSYTHTAALAKKHTIPWHFPFEHPKATV